MSEGTPATEATTAERNHLESLIRRSTIEVEIARQVAEACGLEGPAERIAWALDFLADAAAETTKAGA